MKGAVNRNRLFYLRGLKGKASRIETQEELLEAGAASVEGNIPEAAPAAPAPEKVAKAEARKEPKAK